jgi:two-component system chemotaxis response regulator CheB
MSLAVPAVPVQADAHQPIRVMVVDDSVVAHDLLSRRLKAEPGIEGVAALRTGREAVDRFERHRPDVVQLDIEMPVLDGLSALPPLLAMDRDLVVVMVSTVTRHHAEAGLKALGSCSRRTGSISWKAACCRSCAGSVLQVSRPWSRSCAALAPASRR